MAGNLRHLHGRIKISKVLTRLHKENIDVASLQEPHLSDGEHLNLTHNKWVGQIHFSSFTKSSRGVAILISKSIPFRVTDSFKDKHGRYIIIKGTLNAEEISLLNIYYPPNYSSEFLTKAFLEFKDRTSGWCIIGGDFN